MTLIAQVDTTKTPAVVVALYAYLDSSYMVAPTWMDVTSVTPPVQTGCTYNTTTKVWAYPAAPKSLLVWRRVSLRSTTRLSRTSPRVRRSSRADHRLTNQQTRILLRRIGGR